VAFSRAIEGRDIKKLAKMLNWRMIEGGKQRVGSIGLRKRKCKQPKPRNALWQASKVINQRDHAILGMAKGQMKQFKTEADILDALQRCGGTGEAEGG